MCECTIYHNDRLVGRNLFLWYNRKEIEKQMRELFNLKYKRNVEIYISVCK